MQFLTSWGVCFMYVTYMYNFDDMLNVLGWRGWVLSRKPAYCHLLSDATSEGSARLRP